MRRKPHCSVRTAITFGWHDPCGRLRRAAGAVVSAEENETVGLNRILVVEDEQTFADNLRAYLSRRAPEVRIALDAETALRAAEDFAPDLVLMDYALGSDDGLQVLEKIRRRRPACHALLMTGHPSDEIFRSAGPLGVSAVLFKPFSFAELNAALASSHPLTEIGAPAIDRRVADRRSCALAPSAPSRFFCGLAARAERRCSPGRRAGDR
jgi:DNA-binding NarL/FixJ family response regulator